MASQVVDYEVTLRVSGWSRGYGHNLRAFLETVHRDRFPENNLEIIAVSEIPSLVALVHRSPVENEITSLSTLYLSLPPRFQEPRILDELSSRYHEEVRELWRSVGDGRCRRGAIYLRPWTRRGSQWICFFESLDRGAARGDQHNLHGQNTSQWKNQETGWQGHQGAIVFDETDGRITCHH